MKLSTVLRENVQSLSSKVESAMESYASSMPTSSSPAAAAVKPTKEPPPAKQFTNNKEGSFKQSAAALTKPKKNVYRPPMLRNSRAEGLKAPSSSSKTSATIPTRPIGGEINKGTMNQQQQRPRDDATATLNDDDTPFCRVRRSFENTRCYGIAAAAAVVVLILAFVIRMVLSSGQLCGFDFYGTSWMCRSDDIVVGRAVGLFDSTKQKKRKPSQEGDPYYDSDTIGGWFGGGGAGATAALQDVAGSVDVPGMISSWMQNVDFSQFAAAAETPSTMIELDERPAKRRGIVGFFQRRFGKKENRSTKAVSGNRAAPDVVIHQHVHHVIHHVVHEMR